MEKCDKLEHKQGTCTTMMYKHPNKESEKLYIDTEVLVCSFVRVHLLLNGIIVSCFLSVDC